MHEQDLGDEVWEVIGNNRESFRTLLLTSERQTNGLDTSLELPRLKELTLGGEVGQYLDDGFLAADFLVMPQLELLTVHGGKLGRAGLDELISSNHFYNLQELRLQDLWNLHRARAAVRALATLGNLRRLELFNCTMPDELIKRMCVASPVSDVIWPHLEVLDIGDKIEKMLSGRILNMARLRGPQPQPKNGGGAEPVPWAILEVQVSSIHEIPKLWRAEIAALAQEAARLRE